jgi:hypothetical protein
VAGYASGGDTDTLPRVHQETSSMPVRSFLARLPLIVTLGIIAAMLIHGPIAQFAHYHAFADGRALLGVPNFADVVSNLGFVLVGVWGLLRLAAAGRHPSLVAGWPGYRLFLWALVLTGFGSSFYHLAPDDARLVWDRLPIALACAGLLAAVRAESGEGVDARRWAVRLSAFAAVSVAWWRMTELAGQGDLRPYLLLQLLPMLLIPLWQWLHGAPRADRLAFGLAVAFYALAKLAEAGDHQILQLTRWISGHTLKHLLASAGAAALTLRLVRRIESVHARATRLLPGYCATPPRGAASGIAAPSRRYFSRAARRRSATTPAGGRRSVP